MKECILVFLLALVIGSGINGMQPGTPAPPPQQDPSAAKADEAGTEVADFHNAPATSDQAFDNDVLKSDKPVLVDFYSDGCVPCKMMAPVIGKLANAYEGKSHFFRLNVDDNPAVTARYNVTTIPTFVIFAGGKKGESFTGVVPKEMLTAALDKAMK